MTRRRLNLGTLACFGVITLGTAACYLNTFRVPFLFDDTPSIVANPSLGSLASALHPPLAKTVSGRPFLNLTLAADHAASGTQVTGYHVTNLWIHILAGLVLFGIIRRTLVGLRNPQAGPVAFAASLLWSVHPLNTEAVTYIVQRAESLMGLLYLLTLYCLIRGAGTAGKRAVACYFLCVASCLLGMATKEVMATAPLVALLYDRTFLAGSFKEALRCRWVLYACLAGTWVFLAVLVVGAQGRGGSAGFGTAVSWHAYALTQIYALTRYLQLSLIPYHLVFDYGSSMIAVSKELVLCGVVLLGLVAATTWALIRRPALGFLGASFFIILAPSSSVIPVVTEAMAEHRMYLSLASVSVLFVLAMQRLLKRGAVPVCVILAAILAVATWQRNETYGSVVGIWADTVQRRPDNARAHNNLGTALGAEPRHIDEAIAQYEDAVRIDPGFVDARYNLACDLDLVSGRKAEAIEQYEAVIRLRPDKVGAHYNLACDLDNVPGERDDAIAHYRKAIELDPGYAEAHYNLGGDLAVSGQLSEAIDQFKEAIRARPDYPDAHFNLGVAYNNWPGHSDEAIREFSEAVRLRPDYFMARFALARDLAHIHGKLSEALHQYAEALRIQPDNVDVLLEAAAASSQDPGSRADAVGLLEHILKLEPGNSDAQRLLDGLQGSR